MSAESWSERLFGGLRKTSERLSENLSGITDNLSAVVTKTRLDEDQLDDLEDALILSDLGPRARRRGFAIGWPRNASSAGRMIARSRKRSRARLPRSWPPSPSRSISSLSRARK